MKYLERRRTAIYFLKVGFVVVAIFFCCFVLDPEQVSVTDVVCADDCDRQVTLIAIGPTKIVVHHQLKFKLPLAMFWPSNESIHGATPRPCIVPEFHALHSAFLSHLTINAP